MFRYEWVPMPELTITRVTAPAHVAIVRDLLTEYGALPNVAVCVGGFADELAGLPAPYAPPGGALLLAHAEGIPAGCVGLCRIDAATCEMRRMFVRPEFRGHGIGRALAMALLAEARRLGYTRMHLDTLPSMVEAIALYRSLGFRQIPLHGDAPTPGALFFELELDTPAE
jgi:carbonic anhydrase